MAASVVALIPVLIVFLSLQKYFVQGVASSGLKADIATQQLPICTGRKAKALRPFFEIKDKNYGGAFRCAPRKNATLCIQTVKKLL